MRTKLKFYPQYDQMDCGPACLRMLAQFYGKLYSIHYLRELCVLSKDGASLLNIQEAAKKIGFSTICTKVSFDQLLNSEVPLPYIVHWNQNHFVIVHKIHHADNKKKIRISLADPGHGMIKLTARKFLEGWTLPGSEEGIVMAVLPSEQFGSISEPEINRPSLYDYLKKYLSSFKGDYIKIVLSLLFGTLLTLLFPFLTQALIDVGIQSGSLDAITIILLAQLSLYLGITIIDLIRNWLVYHLGTKVNLLILTDFIGKLFKLPQKFYDTKLMGDISQRVNDHDRIDQFVSSQSFVTVFSLITFSTFIVILGVYSTSILYVYIILTLFSLVYMNVFLPKRRTLDYLQFQANSQNQESLYEIINGIQEIKLNNNSSYIQDKWEDVQFKIFKIKTRILSLDQLQVTGFSFINQLKNIIVTYLAAREVIIGNLTLGAMLSIVYIIGQMNGPFTQLLAFVRSIQDAKISFSRFKDIYNYQDEDLTTHEKFNNTSKTVLAIRAEELSFQYEGKNSPLVINNLSLLIPSKKVTAVVGASGSGKTTLLKLLLKIYEPTSGSIYLDSTNLATLSAESWREKCGVVMQDGFIFSDTIARNIALKGAIHEERVLEALEAANLLDFVMSLPQGVNTKIGAGGINLSGGQRQRILIARIIYKDPDYIFFDEATSALDAKNEAVIVRNLAKFFVNKTVFIIAHRLSTVRDADNIIVMDEGQIVEFGNHLNLIQDKGHYYNLVKNQLELGT